jgi:hypothetical protein
MTPRTLRFGLLGLLALGLIALTPLAFVPVARAEDPPMPPDPGMGDPGMGEPAMDDPGMADPGMADPGMADPAAPATPTVKCEMVEASAELNRLKEYLKNKNADNGDITAAMDAVMKCYKGFVGSTLPDETKYLADVEKELMKTFLLTKVKPNTETNLRDDVNIKAAQLLAFARPGMTKDIKDALESKIFKAKEYKPAPTFVDEAFKAIGLLNDHKVGLRYLIDEYTTKFDNTAGRPERIKAAWEALLLFKDVSMDERYEVVKNAVKTYVGPEHSAEVNKTADDRMRKDVWDKIKGAVIKTVQSFAKDPKDEKGNVIATMKGIEDWFRDNDKKGKPPWEKDAKPGTSPAPAPAPAK